MRSLSIVLAQDVPIDRFGEARRQFEASWHPHTYIESLGSGSSWYLATNILMILAFLVSVFLILRGASQAILTLSLVAPLIIGSTAMLIQVLQLTDKLGADYFSVLSSGHSLGVNALKELRSIPFPFYTGAALSAGGSLLLCLRVRRCAMREKSL